MRTPLAALGRTLIIVLTLLALLVVTPGCQSNSGDPATTESEERDQDGEDTDSLGEVEISEYEGKDLSSVDEFRENSIKGPQEVDIDTYTLTVTGLVDTPLELSYEDVLAERDKYEKLVTLNCVEGWSVDILWEGIMVSDLFESAGVQPEATVAIFKAVDGYSTALPVEYLRNRQILMAYKMNGIDLPEERGYPFQLVAERKWGYKWIKWINEIELSADTEYRGYWEERGFSNEGDLGGSFYE